MSDDIVTRLRICRLETTTGDLCVEAADEIERLREQNEHLRTNVEMLLAVAREADRG